MRRIFPTLLLLTIFLLGACKKGKTGGDSTNTPDPEVPSVPSPAPTAGPFIYGSNMGYYPGWTDEQLAEILIGNPAKDIAGAGVNSLRPAMYDHFVEQWGYDIRLNAFALYSQLGGKDHTLFLNGPADAHREQTRYCNDVQSQTFANLYEAIWLSDGVVNPENYYANYVYNVVKTYGAYVKYWEVWNEPDYTNNWQATQTWDHSDPNPCDLTTFAAPIQSYVRMLRITYEIVRQLDNDGLVCVGGLGYPTFLDAILRNTDNPDGGKVSTGYPKKGGEWFDCLSYHVYPMYDLGNNRHSDAAAAAVVNHKKDFQEVLERYAYDGSSHPEKTFIVTEVNIPRKAIGDYVGGNEVQRNFLIKAAVVAQRAGISALYIFGPAENTPLAQVTEPYQAMGLYQRLGATPYEATITPGGTAWRTVSYLLRTRHYDVAASAALALPDNVDGGAFYDHEQEDYIYVLWAKTSGTSETASANYTFPTALGIDRATQFDWQQQERTVTGTVELTGAPIFIKPL